MPLGLDAPTSIGMALLVLGPAFIGFKQAGLDEQAAANATWQLGMASLVVMGVLKLVLSFFGDAVTRAVPRAGLLGSIGGAALTLLGFLPLIETLRQPIVGFVTFGLLLYVLVAKGRLPVKLPALLLAFIVGTALSYGLGLAGLGAPGFKVPEAVPLALTLPLPTLGLAGGPGLHRAVPPAAAAVRSVDGGRRHQRQRERARRGRRLPHARRIAGRSGVHAGRRCLRRRGADHAVHRPARVQAHGRAQGLHAADGDLHRPGGVLGYVSGLVQWLPVAVLAPIIVYVGLDITVQAFTETPRKHAIAVALGFLPSVAYLLTIKFGNPAWSRGPLRRPVRGRGRSWPAGPGHHRHPGQRFHHHRDDLDHRAGGDDRRPQWARGRRAAGGCAADAVRHHPLGGSARRHLPALGRRRTARDDPLAVRRGVCRDGRVAGCTVPAEEAVGRA